MCDPRIHQRPSFRVSPSSLDGLRWVCLAFCFVGTALLGVTAFTTDFTWVPFIVAVVVTLVLAHVNWFLTRRLRAARKVR